MAPELPIPLLKEDQISQVPALHVLQGLGYRYLTREQAVEARGGRTAGVLLEGVLAEQLRKINRIRFKGNVHAFSEGNIQAAIADLKGQGLDGLIRTNAKVYDLLTLGRSLTQVIDGDMKSFQFNYVDWKDWRNNVYHVTEEFAVDRTGGTETRRPDLVLFVNGIPFCVIECKRNVDPGGQVEKDPLDQAVSQQIRNQKEDEIPRLFVYAQLLLAVSRAGARYGTVGTPAKFWAEWKEVVDEAVVGALVNRVMTPAEKDAVFGGRDAAVRGHFEALEATGRAVTEQDRVLFALCRPERLLELVLRYTVFDAGERKIARYQQYLTVKTILERIRRVDEDGRRSGGVVWHTQGSGKSLTMVLLAEGLALEELPGCKVVLVTDRVDLDEQIYGTFRHCGAEPVQATTGRGLVALLEGERSRIITTVIDKFEAAVAVRGVCNPSSNIFVLVDESHRTQYGSLHARMRKALPNACFIGFTGTPVMKRDRNTVERFGGIIQPTYTIRDAVRDRAVVPLLYEGRHLDQTVEQQAIDAWFGRVTANLSPEQALDLKRKFSKQAQLNKALHRVRAIAWDVTRHFADNWKGTPFKGQLVAPNKATALRYKQFLDDFGEVTSEVVISGPDEREGEEDVYTESEEAVAKFWKAQMARYGNEKEYNRQVISAFKHSEEPEIIIVVSKLTTGFDAPRNTVLYLCRGMEGHELLQTIARVNRLHDGKDFGYIVDYCGVLKRLDDALDVYGSLEEFDAAEVDGVVTDVSEEVRKLPQRHSDLWEVFKGVTNRRDQEAYERHLADEAVRAQFYERLRDYGRALGVALSTVCFIRDTPEDKVTKYKEDLRFFMTLRTAVRRRYAEAIDFRAYEGKVQKLLDAHVGAKDVEVLTPLVNIFDVEAFAEEVDKLGSPSSKADTIAHRTKATITVRMDEDPAFYKKFSTMLEDTIAEYRAQRITDLEYLRRVQEIRGHVVNHTGDDVPEAVRGHDLQRAFFGVVREGLGEGAGGAEATRTFATEAAQGIDEIIRTRRIVNWKANGDVKNRMRTEIEDLLFALSEKTGRELSFERVDEILEMVMRVAMRMVPA